MQRKVDTGGLRGRDASRALLRVAEGQHGVVAARQLPEVTWEALRTRIAAGWLIRLHQGVYAVGSTALTRRGRWLAAVLACGEGAALSHWDSAALRRLIRPGGPPVHVTVPTHAGRARQLGIQVHRSITSAADGVERLHGIHATAPARTLIDLASTRISDRDLERALDEAERLRVIRPSELREAAAHSRRRGARRLRRLLARHEPGSTLTRSELEERFIARCRRHGIEQPLVNAGVMGLTVDFLWPRAGLVVEVDGRGTHDTERGFQDDRDRDSLLVANGFRVLRFTWFDVTRRPAVVAERVRRTLADRA